MDNYKNLQMVVSPKGIIKVQKFLEFKCDVWKYNKVHVHQLQQKKKSHMVRLVGLWFNTED
jgi:hypothetical protein